jgi:hypothetical protein
MNGSQNSLKASPPIDFKRLIHVMEVHFDRTVGDVQPARNCLVGQSLGHQTPCSNLQFRLRNRKICSCVIAPHLSNYTIDRGRGRRRRHHSCAIGPDKRRRHRCHPPDNGLVESAKSRRVTIATGNGCIHQRFRLCCCAPPNETTE